MRAKDLYQARRVGAAFAFARHIQSCLQSTQIVEQEHILRQGDDQHGGCDRFALEPLWRTFAVPTLIQLTESINDMFVETKPFGEALRHLTMTREHRLDVRGGHQTA